MIDPLIETDKRPQKYALFNQTSQLTFARQQNLFIRIMFLEKELSKEIPSASVCVREGM